MKNISVRTKWISLGATILVVIAIILLIIHHHKSTDTSEANSTATTTNASTVTSTTSVGIALSSTGENSIIANDATISVPVATAPRITINLLTPIANNLWTIGQPNPIAWSAAANITGEIDLVDASTKQFIGVILSNTGSNQTSYIWDARSIYLGRYSADKKDIVPGVYSIRIHFDGNGLGDLISGPITITN
jgi:hypothetical protein